MLGLFAHCDQDLKNFPDRFGIDVCLCRMFTGGSNHLAGPLVIPHREPFADFDIRDLYCQSLPLCNQSDDIFIDMVNLRSD